MEYETEEQQVEALKKWWAENGRSVILGVAIGAAAIVGWQWWNNHQLSQAQAASDGFSQTLQALNTDEDAAAAAKKLRAEHSDSLYATLASLAAAREFVQNDDLEAAATELEWAVENSPQTEISILAKIRLARVQGALGDADKALSTLPSQSPAAFTVLVEEVRGDLYVAKGELSKARTAYAAAIESGEQGGDMATLTMKLDELATTDDAAEKS